MKNQIRFIQIFSLAFLCFALSSCLKTRAQMKQDQEDEGSSKPIPAQVESVQPQGQYVIDEIKAEITRMTGRIDDLERSQKQGAATSDASKQDEIKKLEGRIQELEKAQAEMIESIKKFEQNAPQPEKTELFQKAKAAFDLKEYDSAVDSFSEYLKSAKAKKAEEATYLRAESYFNLKQYKKAIVDYSKFTDKFTTSRHVPAALYKIGLSFEALGMESDAKGFFQELADKFPKSPQAKKVKAKVP